jgi:hypothetical protein
MPHAITTTSHFTTSGTSCCSIGLCAKLPPACMEKVLAEVMVVEVVTCSTCGSGRVASHHTSAVAVDAGHTCSSCGTLKGYLIKLR